MTNHVRGYDVTRAADNSTPNLQQTVTLSNRQVAALAAAIGWSGSVPKGWQIAREAKQIERYLETGELASRDWELAGAWTSCHVTAKAKEG